MPWVILLSTKIFTIVLFISFLFSLFESTRIWNVRTSCPESHFLTKTFKIITLNPTQIDSAFIPMVFGNILRTPKYIFHLLFLPSSQSNWLAQVDPMPWPLVILGSIGVLVFTGFIVFQLLKTIRNVTSLHKPKGISTYIALSLIAAFLLLDVLQRTKNFYDSYLPALLLILAVSITYSGNLKFKRIDGAKILGSLVLINTPALIFTLINITPNSGQITKEFGDKIVSDCRITNEQIQAGNFILDPSLSRYFWKSPRFIYSSYLWGWWAQDVEPKGVIERMSPPIIIVRSDVPLAIKPTDVIIGDFVCRNSKTTTT